MFTAEKGVLYQATGLPRYLALCACSVQSLRWVGYDGPVRVLVDNLDFDESLFAGLDVELHVVQVRDEGKMNSRWVKTHLSHYSPFERTLFLDCDIIVLQHPDRLWEAMGDADMAFAPCVLNVEDTNIYVSQEEYDFTLAQGLRGRQFNGGVKAWRAGEKTDRFFDEWNREWQRFKHIDQLALLRALKLVPLNVCELPSRFNHLKTGSILEIQQSGVVFWHPVGGQDIKTFQAVFGQIFDNHCRALKLEKGNMLAPHNVRLLRKIKILTLKNKLETLKRHLKWRAKMLLGRI